MSNFNFLKNNKNFNDFSNACIDAEKSIQVSPSTCATITRKALELSVKWLYANDSELKLPYQDNLSSLIHNSSFVDIIDYDMLPMIKYIVKLGNLSVHTNQIIKREEAILSLRNLHNFVSWIDYCYSSDYTESVFDESILLLGEEKRTKPEELKNLYESLSSKDRKLEEVIKENERLRKELTEKRKLNTENYDFKIDKISESETRKRYIDLELKLSGWDFDKDVCEEVRVEGMPNKSGIGRVDYVLYGDNKKPLAIVEAKKASKDSKVASYQAKLYADCIEKQYNQRPIIFYTNGFDIFINDDFSERRVYGFYKKQELQLMIDRRLTRKSLSNIKINDDITNRYYQKEAIISVCEAFENNQRKALLVCATGTGKTRTAISIVDVLSKNNWVKNVLFLADRKALVRQAKNNFSKLLPNLSLCNLLDSKDNPEEARMIFSTYPTMMNSIDEAKSKDGKRLFTPGYFDLIIVDESHRSIYKKYKSIFEYFDSYLIGLTATPKDEIDKNTYSVFDLENRVPTYAYDYDDAVKDGYLVDFYTIEVKTKVMEEGIKYDELSEDEKLEFEETFNDDENIDKDIDNSAVNKWLFNLDTIDLVLNNLMTRGLKVEGEEKLGKTIIFAKNITHTRAIVERFNALYPQYGTNFIKAIDYSIEYVESLLDDFSDNKKFPQIAVSVDMLDTGIDIPEILNLVFFKKVRSKTKFWQMIGRGTRLCSDLLGVGIDKDKFLIFDYGNNFEFFRLNSKNYEGRKTETLTEKIFNLKVSIIKELQDIKYAEEKYINFRKDIVNGLINSIKSLNESSYLVRMNLKYVETYKDENNWENIDTKSKDDIKNYIAPLIVSYGEDELAKRFDVLMYNIILGYLQDKTPNRYIKNIIQTSEKLSKLGTIPQVKDKKETIKKAMDEEVWSNNDIFEVESIRLSLRDLVKYIEKSSQKIYYTSFSDTVVAEETNNSLYNVNDLKDYKKKVQHYLHTHKDELVIYKLRNNKKITKQDLEILENILFSELGNKSDYKKEFGDTPITKLVRNLVGLDRNTANEVFSEFLNNDNFNSKQIHFVKLIVDYIVKNGFIEDNKVLMEDPFRSVGRITDLFENNIEEMGRLVKTINELKSNLDIV